MTHTESLAEAAETAIDNLLVHLKAVYPDRRDEVTAQAEEAKDAVFAMCPTEADPEELAEDAEGEPDVPPDARPLNR